MAATIRLYRRFYKATSSVTGETYSLITPNEIVSTEVYLKDTSTLVESISSTTEESTGVYYVDLNPTLYSFSNTYDLKWTVIYIQGTDSKILTTSFRLQPINIAHGFDIEVEQNKLEVEIKQNEFEVIIIQT